MYDYDGDFGSWQKMLDDAGVNADISMMAGATRTQIESTVKRLIKMQRVKEEQACQISTN